MRAVRATCRRLTAALAAAGPPPPPLVPTAGRGLAGRAPAAAADGRSGSSSSSRPSRPAAPAAATAATTMFLQRLNPLTGVPEWVVVGGAGAPADESTRGGTAAAAAAAAGGAGDAAAASGPGALDALDGDPAMGAVVATSGYLDMLNDGARNEAYAAAIRRVLTRRVSAAAAAAAAAANVAAPTAAASHPPPEASAAPACIRVLDIGTGTGLLAMLAARAGDDVAAAASAAASATAAGAPDAPGARSPAGASPPAPAPVSVAVAACEVFPPMAACAARALAANGLLLQEGGEGRGAGGEAIGSSRSSSGAVALHRKRSDELTVGPAAPGTALPPGSLPPDLPARVDVIITEIFDSELLGEGLLSTMRDASARLARAEGGAAVPAAGRILAQVVECPALREVLRGSSWEDAHAPAGWDGSSLLAADHDRMSQRMSQRPLPPVVPVHTQASALSGRAAPRPLTRPAELWRLDLLDPPPAQDSRSGGPGPAGPARDTRPRFEATVRAAAAGRADALLLWWQLDMSGDGFPPLDTESDSEADPTDPAGSREFEPSLSASSDSGGRYCLLATAPDYLPSGHPAGNAPGQRWRDHWKQMIAPCYDVIRVPEGQDEEASREAPVVAAGQALRLCLTHDELNLFAAAEVSSPPASAGAEGGRGAPAAARAPAGHAAGGAGAAVSGAGNSWPRRWALRDTGRTGLYVRALAAALRLPSDLPSDSPSDPVAALPSKHATGGLAPRPSPPLPSAPAAPGPAAPGSAVGPLAGDWVVVLGSGSFLPRLLIDRLGVPPRSIVQLEAGPRGEPPGAAGRGPQEPSWRRAASLEKLAALLRAAAAAAPAATTPPGATPPGPPRPFVRAVVGEPHYREADAAPAAPWLHALRFWSDVACLRDLLGEEREEEGAALAGAAAAPGARPVLRGAALVPARARLLAAGAALPDLAASRAPLGSILGIDLRSANALLGSAGEPPLGWRPGPRARGAMDMQDTAWAGPGGALAGPPALLLPAAPARWQCGAGYHLLTEAATALTFDFSAPLGAIAGPPATAPALAPRRGAGTAAAAVCDTVLFYVDYELIRSNGGEGAGGADERWVVSSAPEPPPAESDSEGRTPLGDRHQAEESAALEPPPGLGPTFWRRQAPHVLPPGATRAIATAICSASPGAGSARAAALGAPGPAASPIAANAGSNVALAVRAEFDPEAGEVAVWAALVDR